MFCYIGMRLIALRFGTCTTPLLVGLAFVFSMMLRSVLLCWLHISVDILYVVEVFELFNHLVDGFAFFVGNVL